MKIREPEWRFLQAVRDWLDCDLIDRVLADWTADGLVRDADAEAVVRGRIRLQGQIVRAAPRGKE